MGCGIYSITNKINDKVYIGSTTNFTKRFSKHKYLLENNLHDNEHLQLAYNKYGKENFEFKIIEECNKEELIYKENYYINLFASILNLNGYNLAFVSDSGRNIHILETKIKNSKLGLKYYSNYNTFEAEDLKTKEKVIFDNLVDAYNYLVFKNYTTGKPEQVRAKISQCLRGKRINNGDWRGAIRRTAYKHNWKILN